MTTAAIERPCGDILRSSWALLNALPETILLVDGKGQILKANQVAETMFLCPVADLIGTPIDLLLYADASNREVGFRSVLSGVTDSDVTQHLFQTVGLRHNGTEFPCEASVKATEKHHRRDHWLITLRDTVKRDFHESRIRETGRMDAVAEVAARVANDFNNQLAAISGNLESLRAALERDGCSVRREIQAAREATDNAARVMRRLSAVAGQNTSVRRMTDPRDLVEIALGVVESNATGNTRINSSFNHDDWMVSADTQQFVDILVNCCHNALEATEGSGSLTVSTHRVNGAEGSEDGPAGAYVRIDIADTGRGISRENLPRIFEPFFTTKSSRGAGLGLAAVYNALKSHKGGITVESTAGEGTTFHIFLPHAIESPAVSLQASRTAPATARTVLVIEDEPAIRQLTQLTLESRGYDVLVADDAVTGLDLYRENATDIGLVISDVVMPGMSGWEVLTELKRTDAALPVIVVSGYPEAREHGEDAPAPDALLRKPYQLEELMSAVRQLLD